MSGAPRLMKAALSIALAVLLVAKPALAFHPLEKNDPDVAAGQEAYAKGDYTGALEAFDRAKTKHPRAPEIDFNRGIALSKLGRAEEAKEAFQRAADGHPTGLDGKANFNLGNTYAQSGERDKAIAAYRRALRQNPSDEAARRNLEMLLRQVPPPQKQPDGGQSDAGQKPDAGDGGQQDAGRDAGSDAGHTDAGQDAGAPDGGQDGGANDRDGGTTDGGAVKPDGGQDGGTKPQETKDAGEEDAGMNPQTEPREAEGGFDGGVEMTPEEAKRLLDAMKNSERNLQLWRFQQKKQRSTNEKDW